MRALIAAVVLCSACVTPGREAGGSERETAPVERELRAFLTAFENLAWDDFRAHFDDQACVFYPSRSTPERFCGRQAVEARFAKVFDETRAGASSPPYLKLDPVGLRVERLSDDAALATFELHNAERIARRSVVFARRGGRWLIVHLHASNVPMGP